MPVDIMIPFWGEPELLYETVRSVQAQRNPDWVLTVVDDLYPDPSVEEWFAALDDPRIRYVRNERNLGITGNFRRCAQLATHEVVAIPGCDDVLMPNYVDVVLDAHRRHPEADIIQPGVQVIDGSGQVVRTLADSVKRLTTPRGTGSRLVGGERLAASLLQGDWLYWPSLAFRRETLGRADFRDGYPIIQDLALLIDLVLDGCTLLVEPEVCFSYRRHTTSASMAQLADGERFEGERDYFRLAAALMDERGWRRGGRAARLHALSRAHALTLLPSAVLARRGDAARVLLRHAFTPLGPARDTRAA
jgi:glycosyltransferase involved in cell wall biosynthesis